VELREQAKRAREEELARHQKEIEDKDKQGKMMQAMQEKMRKDLEKKLED
jgi:hypothetical protein